MPRRRSGVTLAYGARRRQSGVTVNTSPNGKVLALMGLSGTGSVSQAGTGALSMALALAGTSTVSQSGAGSVSASMALSGTGSVSQSGTGSVSMTMTLTGSGLVSGNLTLFGQEATGSSLTSDTESLTIGVQFSVSSSSTLQAIWWYSPSGAGSLPGTIGLYAVSGASLVHSETASWSGAAGTGWVRAAFSSPPSLTASTNYKGVIFHAFDSNNFYSTTANYWSSGAGSGGITNGKLSAPNNAGGDGGQDTFNGAGSIAYPSSSFNASNYWVDVEVQ